jgi:ribosomal protein L21E
MSRLMVGDRVEIIDTDKRYKGLVGVVTDSKAFAVFVQFDSRKQVAFDPSGVKKLKGAQS